MPASQDLHNPAKDHPSLLRVSRPLFNQGLSATTDRLRLAVHAVSLIFAGTLLLFAASGCLATRGWVNDQMNPIKGQLNQTDAKADQALNGLQNLHLVKQLVLDSSHGPTFAFGSAALTANAKRQIEGFFEDLQGSTNPASTSERLIVVAGYTDSIGREDYNYQLGQRRADQVAGYLVSNENVDPAQIRAVSYGPSHPVADNDTSGGRRRNRRVEVLVYQQKITSGGGDAAVSDAASNSQSVE
jgi:outer membrane protein OmpA-like peptidoglycan-associated protein